MTDNFIYFTFPCIKTQLNKNGIEKKKPMNMPSWKEITADNYRNYVHDAHKCRAVLTGSMSGITVIDFDDMNSYQRMLEEYPDLKNHKTIKTKNGVHVYCKYDATVLTTTNACIEYAGIDIRNDLAVVFAPPTKYKLLDGTMIHYSDLGGEILPIPDIIRSNLKQCQPKVECQKIIIKSKEQNIMNERITENLEIVESNVDFLKYQDYAGICDLSIFAEDYEAYFKFQRASSNIGIPFDLFDEIVSQPGAGNYDKEKNKIMFNKPHNEDKGKLGWRFIFKFANDSNPKEKQALDVKYKTINRAKINAEVRKEKEMSKALNYQTDTSNEIFATESEKFERYHTKIINNSVYVKQLDDRIIILSKKDLITSYEHMTCGVNKLGIPVSFIRKWTTCNDKINNKDTMEIYPDAKICPANVFNLLTPFDMEIYVKPYTIKTEALQIILKHIEILCNNEKLVYEYFIGWIAMMIQHPEIKTTLIAIISKEGAGKGTLMQLFSKMMGANKVFETKDPARDVWGQFNGLMLDAFLVNLNELEYKETMEAEGKIKALITDSKMSINQKGMPQINITSHHHFIITTNKENPIKTEKDDRRKLIIRSSDELIKNKVYFDQMYKLLENIDVIKTCYTYFKNYDVSTYNFKNIPQTEHQEDMKEVSLPPVEKWLCDFVRINNDRTDIEMLGADTLT